MGPSLTKEEAHSKLHARCFEYAKRSDGYRKFDSLFHNYNIEQEDIDRVLRKRDKEGDSLFMVACAHGNVRTARFLLQKGARSMDRNEHTGYTALHAVCARKTKVKSEAMLHMLTFLLLEAKADPLVRDYLFRMPTHLLQLDHLGKRSPKMLRHIENIISPFAAMMKVECYSSMQTAIGPYIGDRAEKKLSRRLGRRWNAK